jgi:hypothetical protein
MKLVKPLLMLVVLTLAGVSSFAQAQTSPVVDQVKAIIDAGTVKIIFLYVGGSTVVRGETMQYVSVSQWPLLMIDDSKQSWKCSIDLSRAVAFNYLTKEGALHIFQ